MKRQLHILLTLAVSLAVTSCMKEVEEGSVADGGTFVDATFVVDLGPRTKAFADGKTVNTLYAGIYETDDATHPTTFKWVADNAMSFASINHSETSSGGSVTFTGKIQSGKTYRVVFWAMYASDVFCDTDPQVNTIWQVSDLTSGPFVEFDNYGNLNIANDEKWDAFYGHYDTGVVTGSIDLTGSPVSLKRPFAQVNVLVPNGNIPAQDGPVSSSMTIAQAPTRLYLATGVTAEPKDWNFALHTISEPAFGNYANSHRYVAMNYVLVDQDPDADARYDIGFTVKNVKIVNNAEENLSVSKSIAGVPLKPNGRTNIVDAIYAASLANNQVQAPEFDASDVGCVGTQLFVGANVEMRTYPVDAEIYYTTDGSTPSRTNGTKYTAAMYQMPAVESITLKAIACKDGWADSEVKTQTYTIPHCAPPQNPIAYNWWPDKILLNWGESENADYYTITWVKQGSSATPSSKQVGRLVGYTYIDNDYADPPLEKGTTYVVTYQANSDFWLDSSVTSMIVKTLNVGAHCVTVTGVQDNEDGTKPFPIVVNVPIEGNVTAAVKVHNSNDASTAATVTLGPSPNPVATSDSGYMWTFMVTPSKELAEATQIDIVFSLTFPSDAIIPIGKVSYTIPQASATD